jgi:hypothetical protein
VDKVTLRVGLNSLDALHRSLGWKSKAFAVAKIVRTGTKIPTEEVIVVANPGNQPAPVAFTVHPGFEC